MKDRYLPPGIESSSQAYEQLIDHQMSVLSGGAWKTMSFIARRTVGFGKPTDKISLSQICRGIKTRDGRQLDRGTGLSRKAAVRAVAELEEKKLITKSWKRRDIAALFALNWQVIIDSQKETSGESIPAGGSETIPDLVAKVHQQPAVQPAGLQRTNTPSANGADSCAGWFSEFWPLYWLKVGKKDAGRAFKKAVKTEATWELIKAAVIRQTPGMMARQPDKRPHAATWLNGERWNDETETAAPAEQPSRYRKYEVPTGPYVPPIWTPPTRQGPDLSELPRESAADSKKYWKPPTQ